MASRIGDSVINFGHPYGTKVFAALTRVSDLCASEKTGSLAQVELHRRLQELYDTIEDANGVQDHFIDEYVATLEEFWRVLASYADMTVIERLLNLTKFSKAIKDVRIRVDELFDKVGLATTADAIAEWEKQHKDATAEQRKKVEDIASDSADLMEELHGVRAWTNALALMNAEIRKIDQDESNLPEESQRVIKKAQRTIEYVSKITDIEETPEWFIPEADVSFNEKPIGVGSFASVRFGKFRSHFNVVVKILTDGST